MKSWLKTVVMIVGLLAFRSSVAEPYVVPTSSMEPAIVPGDRLLVLKGSYDLRVPFTRHSLLKTGEPQRGDVIVFRYPPDPSIHYVKRLVGLPGEDLEIVDGHVRVNGEPLAEGRYGHAPYEVRRLPHLEDPRVLRVHVPEGHYFFMGDNRDNSNDSRAWGFVPRENIEGRALGIWASLELHLERFGKAL